jgi:putative endonuclease
MYHVYVLESLKDKARYTGCTNDLSRRFAEHNAGKSFATAFRKPFVLIYCESYLSKEDAFKREKFLKTGWGRNYLNRVLGAYIKQNLGG